jgi:PAS domain S-box-containing protein
MFVPARHGERVAGILSIQSYTPRAYDDADLAVLQTLADYCGSTLERLRIEQALRESQAQLERAEGAALVMTAHVARDGRWRKVPPTLSELLGYTERELLELEVADLTHADDVEADRAERHRLIRGEARSYDLLLRLLRRDGRVLWVYANTSVVR